MSQRSTKAQQGATVPITIKLDGGINYAQSPSKISDNELAVGLNIIYNSQTGVPETRPGTACVTTSALAAPILKLFYYEKSASSKWLVAAANGKLYYLSTNTWVEIGALTDASTVPSLLTFNTKLLIADGGTNLRQWDGTTYSSLSDGLNATAIAEIGNRVVINSKTSPDLVTFSGVEDETMWNTADLTNPAIGLRAGFGDNMLVNGFSVFGTDLIVSKRGDASKKFYRVKTQGVPTSWTVTSLSDNNCSQNAHTMAYAFNNVFFVDTNGFKSIKGVTEYGDLQIDLVGSKINTQFGSNTCFEVTYLPAYTAVWFLIADRTYAYHRLSDPNGQAQHAFTELIFSQGKFNSIVQVGDVIYLAGNNGYLYKLDDTKATDETAPSTFSNYATVLETKRFNFFGGGILRRLSVDFRSLPVTTSSSAYIKCNTLQKSGILLKTVSILFTSETLYNATGQLNVATTVLGTLSGNAWIETNVNRARGASLQFRVDSVSGRFGVEGMQAEIAMVGS